MPEPPAQKGRRLTVLSDAAGVDPGTPLQAPFEAPAASLFLFVGSHFVFLVLIPSPFAQPAAEALLLPAVASYPSAQAAVACLLRLNRQLPLPFRHRRQ